MAKTKKQKRRPQPAAAKYAKPAPVVVPPTDDHIPLFILLLATTSMVVGVIWDISWDGSIGKDSLFLIRSANRRVFCRIGVC